MTRKEDTRMKLMILDGNSIVNRAFYGIRMLLSLIHISEPTRH